jgi:hypothetical protein
MEQDNDIKAKLFNLIRKGDVTLWAGAGISVYAGYPSGNSLRDIIFNSMDESEKSVVDMHLPLDDLAEELTRLKSGSFDCLYLLLWRRTG